MKDYFTRVLYSSAINVATYHIMMVKPRGSIISRGLLAPFSGAVWIATAIFFIVMGPIVFAAIKFHRDFGKEEKIKTVGQIIWFVYGALVRQGHSVNISPINGIFFKRKHKAWGIFVPFKISYRFNSNPVRNLVDLCYNPYNLLHGQFSCISCKI